MTVFNLFCLIYLALNQEWEECKDEKLGDFLSEMNPYLWNAEMSADPTWYEEFKEFMQGKEIGTDFGFKHAQNYLKSISYYPDLVRFLSEYDEESWVDGAHQLLNYLRGDEASV